MKFNHKPSKKRLYTSLLLLGITLVCYAHVNISGVPPVTNDEYYSGGKNATVFNTTSRCLEMPAPAVEADEKLNEQFAEGEAIFDADFVTDPEAPYGGLGPLYVNTSCRNCHPNYARARRVGRYNQQFGNGYTAFVHTPDGKLVDGYMFMLQTRSTPPYTPMAKDIKIEWKQFKDEFDNMYPDGTPYHEGKDYEGTLIYPEADIVDPLLPLPENYQVNIEATLGLIGTGLLDAIKDEDIIAEYMKQQNTPGPIKGQHGKWVLEKHDGKKHLGKFTWHNTRATLRNGPCSNGIWNVTNVTRKDRQKLFASEQWIKKQGELGLDTKKLTQAQPEELKQDELENLLVWSRGLAVPAARNLDNPEVQRGRELFYQANCVACHKPSWTTGPSDFIKGYENQKIFPYSDMLLHDMGKANCTACHKDKEVVAKTYTIPDLEEVGEITEKLIAKRARKNHGVKKMNHGVKKTFRTPPIWARALMKNGADHTDMWHDLRARDFEDAILWHYGEAMDAREAFRNMTKSDRKALIKFLESI